MNRIATKTKPRWIPNLQAYMNTKDTIKIKQYHAGKGWEKQMLDQRFS